MHIFKSLSMWKVLKIEVYEINYFNGDLKHNLPETIIFSQIFVKIGQY